MRKTIQALGTAVFSLLWVISAHGQVVNNSGTITGVDNDDLNPRVISPGAPFLSITPDSRAGAMGDVGVATSPDANSTYWNPAKLAFLENDIGFSLSYTPWLANIVDDMSISYLSGYKKINQEQAVGISLRYFDLGDIQLTDENGGYLNIVSPREVAFSGTFSMKLSEYLSAGLTGRFIYSNLQGGGTTGSGGGAQAGVSGAADLAVYYTRDAVVNGKEANISFGANISNIGAKITYLNAGTAYFLPANLRLGTAYTMNLDPFNKLTIAVDFNKLMVPTPPVYLTDSTGAYVRDDQNKLVIAPGGGKDPNRGFLAATFGSFADAPDGLSEELQEVMISAGIEYWYNDMFAVRTGYFYENQYKGNRKYITAGLGLRYQVIGIDFAYLFAQGQNNPLQDTLRLSLLFNFDTKQRQESIQDTEN